jgi:hypothetical protein
LVSAGNFDLVMDKFGIRRPEQQRMRRQFHGDREKVVISKSTAYEWIPDLARAVAGWSPECRSQMEEIDKTLRQFGYSYFGPSTMYNSVLVKGNPNYVSFQ